MLVGGIFTIHLVLEYILSSIVNLGNQNKKLPRKFLWLNFKRGDAQKRVAKW